MTSRSLLALSLLLPPLTLAAGAPAAGTSPSDHALPGTVVPAVPSQDEAVSPTRTEEGLRVRLVSLGPDVVAPGQDVVIEVEVTNVGDDPAADVELAAALHDAVPSSRGALFAWAGEGGGWPTSAEVTDVRSLALEPGEAATRTVRVPAAALPAVDATTWGPRGIEVVARDRAAEVTGTLRTWVVLAPPEVTHPLPFTAVVPLVATTRELASAMSQDDPAGAVRAAALPRLREPALGVAGPATTFAVDPLLLSPAPGPGDAGDDVGAEAPVEEPTAPTAPTAENAEASGSAGGPVADPTAGPSTPPPPPPATLEELLARSARTPVLLPPADADVAALAHAGRTDLLRATMEDARALATASGVAFRSDVLVPVGTTDTATVRAAREAGLTRLVGPAATSAPASTTSWTPSARAMIPLAAGGGGTRTHPEADPATRDGDAVPAVLGDAELGDAVTGSLPSGPVTARVGRLDPVEARQWALALTAVIQRERPNDPRALAVVLDRDAMTDPAAVAALTASLDALARAPWLAPTELGTLEDGDDPVRRTSTLPAREAAASELDPDHVDAISRQLTRVQALADATSDPAAVLEPPSRRLQMLLATGWRESPTARTVQATRLRETLAGATDAVRIAPSSTINLLATSAELPVRVTNTLPVAVRAQVHLDPPDARLTAPPAVPVEIPAHGEATALVPVQARGSGNFELRATISTPTGLALGDPEVIDVRLRADWEGRGAAIGGVVLAAVVLLGIVRTARRSRRARSASAPAAVEQD